jgi:hypothetical protein
MRKVMAVEWMTLDGVVQAPGHRDEDRDGGFEHGGWHLPYFDDAAREWVVEGFVAAGRLPVRPPNLREPRGYWPNASEEEQVIAELLNTKPKYVGLADARRPTRVAELEASHGRCRPGRGALKQEDDGDPHVIGSPRFAETCPVSPMLSWGRRYGCLTPRTRRRPCENCSSTSSPPSTATPRGRAGLAGGGCRGLSTWLGSMYNPRSRT